MIPLHQQGLSLIELMIALVIGLLIIAGVGEVFLSGRASYNLQQRLGDLQENGRFALHFLQQDIRKAGYPKSDFTIDSFNKTLQPAGVCPSPPTTAALTCDGGETISDQIAVSYQGTVDCIGQNVNGGAPGVVTNTFFIEKRRLMCRGNGNSRQQPLVDGIENMQILYGVAAASGGYAVRYIRADELAAEDWAKVVSVRIAVLASTIDTVIGDSPTDLPTFQLLDASGIGPLPAAVRGRVFTTTIEIRNRTQ
jgi:type IV pilus assembly protein PilW